VYSSTSAFGPQGIIDVMSIGLVRDAATIGSVAFGRHRDAGPIGDGQIATARLFVPHLKRAVTISRLLEAKTVKAATFESVLDGLTAGVMLVDADLRLVHANRAAETTLAAGDPLRLHAGAVTAANGMGAALAVAVAGAAAGGAMGVRGLNVPARGRDGAEFVLHVLPLRPGAQSSAILPSVVAAIFIAAAVALRPAPVAAIAALFELTPTEARVLEQVAAGRTNAEKAQALGIRVSTVRTHLLRLFDKTRTHRQADLVALLASFSLPLGG
jgi:DNA-binding CsgD family transcriptional regulator